MTENDKVIITKSKINSIVNAIHYKNNESSGYTLDQMPAKIKAIPSGSGGNGATITITTETEDFYGQEVTLTDGIDTMTASFSNEGVAVFEGVEMEGELTVSVTVAGETYETSVNVKTHYNVELDDNPKVYGVYWDGSESQVWSRTDDAILFSNPSPALEGGDGSSPFDTIYPWSEMNIVEDAECGTMVKIPKFYYKMEIGDDHSISLKISPKAITGYSICPACADRGDEKGERNYILVSRYMCNDSFRSVSDVAPATNKTRAQFRNGIHALGNNVWQYDIMTHITLWMLYLVEYAHWNSQEKIGYGTNSVLDNGSTDDMVYHTGTMASTRGGSGAIQYRHIEHLWGCPDKFCDGICGVSGRHAIVVKNPADFNDNGAGENVFTFPNSGSSSAQYIKYMGSSSSEGYEWFVFPSAVGDGASDVRYVGDAIYSYDAGTRGCIVAGSNAKGGLFNINIGDGATVSRNVFGSRLIKLP